MACDLSGSGVPCCSRYLANQETDSVMAVAMPYAATFREENGFCGSIVLDDRCGECAQGIQGKQLVQCDTNRIEVPDYGEKWNGIVQCDPEAEAGPDSGSTSAGTRATQAPQVTGSLESGDKFPVAAVAGGLGGAGLLGLLLLGALLCWCCFRNSDMRPDTSDSSAETDDFTLPAPGSSNFQHSSWTGTDAPPTNVSGLQPPPVGAMMPQAVYFDANAPPLPPETGCSTPANTQEAAFSYEPVSNSWQVGFARSDAGASAPIASAGQRIFGPGAPNVRQASSFSGPPSNPWRNGCEVIDPPAT